MQYHVFSLLGFKTLHHKHLPKARQSRNPIKQSVIYLPSIIHEVLVSIRIAKVLKCKQLLKVDNPGSFDPRDDPCLTNYVLSDDAPMRGFVLCDLKLFILI